MYALLTHDFKILCFEQQKIIQKDLNTIHTLSEIVFLKNIAHNYSLTDYSQNFWFDFETETMNRAVSTGFLRKRPVENGCYSFEYNGHYMRANRKMSIDFIAEKAYAWEHFKLLTPHQLSALLHLVHNQWFILGQKTASQIDLKYSTATNITLGPLSIDFDHLLNAIAPDNSDNQYAPFMDFIFHVDWKVYKAVLIKPAIVYILFGKGRVLEEFKISIQSLYEIGHYDGDIFIATDLDKEDFFSLIPKYAHHKINIIKTTGKDRLDFVGARISICSSSQLDSYQPILYCDADIVFDRDINNFLYEAASSKKCSAALESFTRFKNSYSVGSDFFKMDPFEIDNVHGFNAGLLMVPNMKNHKKTLQAAYTVMMTYVTQHNRNSIRFYDQSVLNYVLYKLQDFNPSPISERNQIGRGKNADGSNVTTNHENYLLGLDTSNPKGFVHFWYSFNKALDMEAYFEAIKNKVL